MSEPVKAKRTYDATRRQERARQKTRQKLWTLNRGWHDTNFLVYERRADEATQQWDREQRHVHRQHQHARRFRRLQHRNNSAKRPGVTWIAHDADSRRHWHMLPITERDDHFTHAELSQQIDLALEQHAISAQSESRLVLPHAS